MTAFDEFQRVVHADEEPDEEQQALWRSRLQEREAATSNGHRDRPTAIALPEILTLEQLAAWNEPAYDWLVPGLIERGDRVITTGLEGKGKSTLLRQMGAQLAAGIHPFGGEPFDPLRTLIIDLENSKRQVFRKAGPLLDAAGRGDLLHFVIRPEGIRLNVLEGEIWLEQVIDAVHPDVLIMGPVYKMAGGDPRDEQAAKVVSDLLDRLRNDQGFAVLTEAHTPYSESSRAKRPMRPYGASLWSRWPEFGIYLADDGNLIHWRGQRDERQWPLKLMRGDEWPWEVDEATPVDWDGPTRCMGEVFKFLDAATPAEYTPSALTSTMAAVGIKFHRATVSKACEQLVIQGDITVRNGAKNGRYYSCIPNLLGPTGDFEDDPNDVF